MKSSVTWSLGCVAVVALAAVCFGSPVGTQETAPVQDQPQQLDWTIEDEKRAWQNLHGGWGKRGWQDMNGAWGKRAWNNLHGGWGKRGWQDMNGAWGKRAWNNLHGGWGKRDWNKLHGGWGKRDADLLELLAASQTPYDQDYVEVGPMDAYAPLRQVLNANAEKMFDNEPELDAEKRSWNSLRGPWGKRSNSNNWSNLRGSWGKREPGWNNLKGLWGKRSSMDSIIDDSQSAFLDRSDE